MKKNCTMKHEDDLEKRYDNASLALGLTLSLIKIGQDAYMSDHGEIYDLLTVLHEKLDTVNEFLSELVV